MRSIWQKSEDYILFVLSYVEYISIHATFSTIDVFYGFYLKHLALCCIFPSLIFSPCLKQLKVMLYNNFRCILAISGRITKPKTLQQFGKHFLLTKYLPEIFFFEVLMHI